MARPSKLSATQCARIRALKTDPTNPVSAPALAKRFKVSESSIYKVLDGTYVARGDEAVLPKVAIPSSIANCGTELQVPTVPAAKPEGAMPSIFHNGDKETPRRRLSDLTPNLAEMLERAAKASFQEPVDEVTLAAAELVIARAKLNRALHIH
jgi:hypothetical protein